MPLGQGHASTVSVSGRQRGCACNSASLLGRALHLVGLLLIMLQLYCCYRRFCCCSSCLSVSGEPDGRQWCLLPLKLLRDGLHAAPAARMNACNG